MKKKIKVFKAGKYPQGEFSEERVKKIFGNVKNKIETIFSHTSKWKTGETPVAVGEFSNFEIIGNEVFGEIEFNENGSKYYRDGILKGVSVEINNDTLTRVAVLPIGINPAVSGSEFEEDNSIIIEFEDAQQSVTVADILDAINKLNAAELTDTELDLLYGAIWNMSDRKYWADKLQADGYTVTKVEMQQLTQEEMRALVRREVEFETRRDCLKEAIKTKFRLPQHEIVEFAIEEAFKNRDTILEFSENEKTSMFERIEKTIEALPKDSLFIEHHKEIEFSKENETENFFDKSKKETLKIFGGK